MKVFLIILLMLSSVSSQSALLDSLLQESQNYSEEKRIHFLLDNFYTVFSQNYEDGFLLAEKLVLTSEKLNDTFLLGRSYLSLGMAFYMRGDYENCYTNYHRALTSFESINDTKHIGRTYNELSVYYRKQKQYLQAHECLDKSFRLCSECGDTACVETSINNRAVLFEFEGDYKNAIRHYYKAMRIAQSINNNQGLAFIYLDCAYCYKLMNKLDSAEFLVNQSLRVMQNLNNYQGIALNLINLGDIQFQQNKVQDAIKSYNESIKLAFKINYPDLRQQSYYQLAMLYQKTGDYKNATFYLEQSYALKDSIINFEKAKSLADMEVKYQTEKIENDLLVQRQNNILHELKLAQKNKWITILVTSSVVLILVVLIWYQRKLTNKQREKDRAIIDERNKGLIAVIEATENERQRIAKDLHDGIGQQMSGMKLMIGNIDHINIPQLEKVSKLLDKTASELRTISHQMMPKVLSAFGVEPAMRQALEESLNHSQVQFEFDCLNLHSRLNHEIELIIYRVFQELLNNCMKHAKATKISVQLYKNQNNIILVFEDNGVGFEINDKTLSGLGMTNMKIRLDAVDGTISFDSKINQGTLVTVRIPI